MLELRGVGGVQTWCRGKAFAVVDGERKELSWLAQWAQRSSLPARALFVARRQLAGLESNAWLSRSRVRLPTYTRRFCSSLGIRQTTA